MLAVCVVVGLAGTSLAIESTTGIILERLSNPQAGPGEPDGIQPWGTDHPDYPFRGDRWNSYIFSMACYTQKNECGQDEEPELWVGTNRNVIYSGLVGLMQKYKLGFSIEEIDFVINKLFCGNIPTGYNEGDCIDKDFRAQIWKFPICDDGNNGDLWENVYTSDFDDYCCGEYRDWDCMNEAYPLCCDAEWIFGPEWGYRGVITYTPTCAGDSCIGTIDASVCQGDTWPRIIFGGSNSFIYDELPDTDYLRAIAFGHPQDNGLEAGSCSEKNYFPEEVFYDYDGAPPDIFPIPFDNMSIRATGVYKPENTRDFSGSEIISLEQVVLGTETGLYMSCDLKNWTTIWRIGESRGEGIVFQIAQYKDYLYLSLANPFGGFQIWRGKPGNTPGNSMLGISCDDDVCPGEPEKCLWTWEPVVACANGEIFPGAAYPSGMGREGYMAASLAVCDDSLFIGTFTDYFLEKIMMFEGFDGQAAMTSAISNMTVQAENPVLTAMLAGPNVPEQFRNQPARFCFLLDFFGQASHFMLNELVNLDKKHGTQVYRYRAGECREEDSWHLIAGEPTPAFPEGSISNIGGDGFAETAETSNKWNAYTWRMICCNDKLYATTFDARAAMHALTECWCVDEEGNLCNDIFECIAPDVKEDLCCVFNAIRGWVVDKAHGNPLGFDMYRLENPSDESELEFTMITQDGLEDPYNYGGRTLACCECERQSCVYVGTANPFWGGQVHKICEEPPQCPPIVKSGDFWPCGTWTLTLTPCPGSCPDAETASVGVKPVDKPEGAPDGSGEASFFKLDICEGICGVKLCFDFSDCLDFIPEGFFSWDTVNWLKNQDISSSSATFCKEWTDITGIDEIVFGIGEESAFTEGIPAGEDEGSSSNGGSSSSSGGTGCDTGTSTAAFLILIPLGILYFRKF